MCPWQPLRASGANGAVIVLGFQQHSHRPAQKSPLSYSQTHKTLTGSQMGASSSTLRKNPELVPILTLSSSVQRYLF